VTGVPLLFVSEPLFFFALLFAKWTFNVFVFVLIMPIKMKSTSLAADYSQRSEENMIFVLLKGKIFDI
jgi:hypothetical protein